MAEAAQRWVDTTCELSTRRILSRRTLLILASDGAGAPVAAGTNSETQQQRAHHAVCGALQSVAAHIFSDTEQADLLGQSFRIDLSGQVVDELESSSSLQTANVVLNLEEAASDRAITGGGEPCDEVADRYRAVRVWAPHRVLSQFVVDTCRACLSLVEPEQHIERKLQRYRSASPTSLEVDAPDVALGPTSTVLDLNAGTGVCGVFASHGLAAMGSSGHVYLADRCTAALPLLELNCGLNRCRRYTTVCRLTTALATDSVTRFELRGVGGAAGPEDRSVDAIISVLDPFDDEDGHGESAEAFQLWSIIGRYLSMAPSAWVALSCVEASTLRMREDGEVVGVKRKSQHDTHSHGHESLSTLAKRVLEEAGTYGFELHPRQPTVRCLPGAHRERSIRVLVFIRKQSHHPRPTHGVLAPAFADVASRLSPLSHALLIDRYDPSKVSPDELLDSIEAISPADKAAARMVLHGSLDRAVHRAIVLDATQCAALREHCRAHLQMEPDSVDGAPDSQVQLTRADLQRLLGSETVRELWRLPAAARLVEGGLWSGAVDCFLRRYTAETRPFIPFHCDGAAATVNVALTSSAGAGMGGELLCLHSGGVMVERRGEGEATVHPAGLLHGVTRLEVGARERFTMILFFEPPLLPPT